MSAPLAIVIPTLGESAGIAVTLEALQPLRQRGVEVIVVDGGSADDTVRRARPLADRVLVAPRGRGRQMNAGARATTASVLLFLHADTRLPPSADTVVLEALASSPRVWGRFDVRIDGRARVLRVVARLMNLRSRLSGIATGDQAIFVRREAFSRVGGFPDQPLMEDIELSRRLGRLSPPLCLGGPAVTSGRRWETRGVWRTVMLMWRLRWLYFVGVDPRRLAERYR